MLEKGWPWDSTEGDTREYGAQEIADAFTSFIKNGVLDAEVDFLLTPQSGNTLRISSGTAWINGRMLKLDGFEDIAIPYVSASETPRYGVLGLLLRPDVDHRDFTFFYMPPDGNELPALGENEIAIAKIRYDRGTPAISAEHIIRDVERAYTTNPYYDKKGITVEFLNEVVSSYMEFTPEGIAIYDGPASDTGRKMVFGYDVVEKALKMVGEFSTDVSGEGYNATAKLKRFTENKKNIVGLIVQNESNKEDEFYVGKGITNAANGTAEIYSSGRMNIKAVGSTNGGSELRDGVIYISAHTDPDSSPYKWASIVLQANMGGESSVDIVGGDHLSLSGDNISFATGNPMKRGGLYTVWDTGNLKIARGTLVITPSQANVAERVTVSISSYGFSSPPTVMLQAECASPDVIVGCLLATTPTASSFEIALTRKNTMGTRVFWVAIGE